MSSWNFSKLNECIQVELSEVELCARRIVQTLVKKLNHAKTTVGCRIVQKVDATQS